MSTLHRLILDSEITPPIGTSGRRLSPDRWMLGSSKVCERGTLLNPSNAIISWEDGDSIFCLRDRAEGDPLSPEDRGGTGLIYKGGASAAD